jgi:hypothetical protein
MATLTGQSIASSYEQLLHVDNDGGGNGTTLVDVKDGDNGTTFAIKLATDRAEIIGVGGTVSGTPDGDGDEFVIRNNADAGMSILAGESSGHTSSIVFGSASDLNGANIFYEYHTKTMKLGTQHSSGILTLRSGNGSDALTINASAVVQLPQGQLKFPATQNASSDANTLDDYEEGEWTIGFTAGSGDLVVNSSHNTGAYTKIGRVVHVTGNIRFSSGSAGGDFYLSGLPFANSDLTETSEQSSASIYADNLASAIDGYISGVVSGTNIYLREVGTTGAGSDLGAHIDSGTIITFQLTYFTT